MAKLVKDHSAGASAVSVPCYRCGRMHPMVDSTMDLDGPSFRAYYCLDCTPKAFPHLIGARLSCGVWDCARAMHEV